MGLEIERKFRVVDGWELPGNATAVRLRQGYLSAPGAPAEIRVRASGETRLMTVKTRAGVSGALIRKEIEFEVADDVFEQLWEVAAGDCLSKLRWTVPLEADGGLEATVDVYDGVHQGLRVVEVEFPGVAEARGFEPPAWFGEELTGVARWGNRELAAAAGSARARYGGWDRDGG
jgi:adenylate cyclase